MTLHITTHLVADNLTGSKGLADRFKGRNNIIFKTLVSESGNMDSKTDDDWEKTSVTYIMFIRRANFSIKNVVKVLLFTRSHPVVLYQYNTIIAHLQTQQLS